MASSAWPVPSEARLSDTGRRLLADINATADAAAATPDEHGQRIIDLRILWNACERAFERSLASAQAADSDHRGSGLSVRGLARLTGANAGTVQARITAGRTQLNERSRRGKATA